MDLNKYLKSQAAVVNRALKRFAPKGNSLIERAMRYALFAGGKRLRPILVIAGAELCGGKQSDVLPAACAVEFIHTYSLVHDDLPAMDDDDLRRGKPTTHKKFGEATAILAGDALLTEAFNLITLCGAKTAPSRVVAASGMLSKASGHRGMVGGQMKDTVEAGNWRNKNRKLIVKGLDYIHRNKTAALIRASLLIGAVLSGAGKRKQKALEKYGENIGLAFQIADDVLDITADKKLLGKRGSDRKNNKLTYPALFGIEGSRKKAARTVDAAKTALNIFGRRARRADILMELADYIIKRQY
ncbi:MAG: polyprenyl synthetase family protein [Elusimicrobiota bacterium]